MSTKARFFQVYQRLTGRKFISLSTNSRGGTDLVRPQRYEGPQAPTAFALLIKTHTTREHLTRTCCARVLAHAYTFSQTDLG